MCQSLYQTLNIDVLISNMGSPFSLPLRSILWRFIFFRASLIFRALTLSICLYLFKASFSHFLPLHFFMIFSFHSSTIFLLILSGTFTWPTMAATIKLPLHYNIVLKRYYIVKNYWWATMATIKLSLQFFVTSNLYQFTLDPFFVHTRE